ncbi:XRE family transcriptional regulator [Frankia sp. R82]|uniref:XRE family transcriptional regulator n=1 Tax=Frankia sp. R82 TaxID=2950553 RepID=UPI002044CCC6|nr:XRE family transcriptional regulator [Frankia sp. R82]MCM3884303.1 XRE family transcriptional regulator [Frankia sp. R82]
MPEPNHLFRAARLRAESPEAPGEPLARRELAELVNVWIYDATGRETAIDANYVGKLERGLIRWPDALYRQAFHATLATKHDRELGFRRPRRTERNSEDVNRNEFLLAMAGVGAVVATGSFADLAMARETESPSVVGHSEIEKLRMAATLFGNVDHTYGGGFVREAVAGQLRYAVNLLNARCPEHLRNELFVAVGFLGHTAGFMAFDAYVHEDARRMFSLALACAEEAGDWHLRAKALSSMARQAIWRGDSDMGLTLIDVAFIRGERLTSTERAMLLAARARALAKLGREQETLRAVGHADEEFGRSEPANDPVWMAYYDLAQHAGDTGHSIFDLAIRNDKHAPEAARRLESAVAGHSATFARSRAISQTKLASLLMSTGDPSEAAAVGAAALAAAGTINSRRAADDIRELGVFAEHHDMVDEVAELRRKIEMAVGVT